MVAIAAEAGEMMEAVKCKEITHLKDLLQKTAA